MKQLLDFILTNWKLVLTILLELISIIILFCKKTYKSTDNMLTTIFISLPGWIKEAESCYPDSKSGSDKLTFVLKKCLLEIVALTGLSYEDAVTKYFCICIDFIESILSTPTKKGD